MMRNIIDDLKERMAHLQDNLEDIERRRKELDRAQNDIEERMEALQRTLEWEQVLQGRSNGKHRWADIGVAEAVNQLSLDHPKWGHRDIKKRLLADGFDFKSKNPGLSVNQALMRLRRGAAKSA